MQADPSASAHASAATFVRAPLPVQDRANGSAGAAASTHGHAAASPATTQFGAPVRGGGAAHVTGAYELSGDAHIDRMVRLEYALKRYGKVF